jgi:type I restriction enzyme S subunit
MSAKYQVYEEYKDSGIEWLGDIPRHWGTSKLRHMFSFDKGLTITKENLLDEGVPCVNYGEVHSKYGFEVDPVINPLKCVSEKYLSSSQNALLSLGDFVFADTSEDIEGSGNFTQLIREGAVFAGYHTIIVRPNEKKSSRFYAYLFDSQEFRTQIRHSVKGVKVFSVTQAILRRGNIWLPTLNEQQKIANFLDHETAKTDTLIEKQQQLIKLLKEKRQAVISHAVTKGLNPNAPMRDSGVEWLGEVPEHWEVKRINLLFCESSIRASTEVELDYPVLSVSIHHGISDKELNSEELDRKIQRSEDKTLYKVVHENYLAYNMMRAWQGGFGASTLSGLVSPAYVVCKPRTLLNSFYFELVLRTLNAVTELKRYSRGITDFRLRLYWDEFRNVRIPVPPSDEIDNILQAISKTNFTYDNLVIVAVRQVELLQERRTALISAAVTGKIDVRNWQAPHSENKDAIT